MSAFAGIPFIKLEKDLCWNGQILNEVLIKNAIISAIGASAVLTFTNKNNRTLDYLGQLCLDKNELWAYHWINCTFVFSGFDSNVELSFARDTRFKLSWPIEKVHTGKVFAATGSLKDFIKYESHKNDPSFDNSTREAMKNIGLVLSDILP